MKKIISLVLMVVVLFSVSALSEEEFTLHSGVTFGMTSDEIIAKQNERGNSFSMQDGRLTNSNSLSILDVDADIFYDFDENGKMTRQQFYFKNINFAPLAKDFAKVYGEPDCSSILGTHLVLPDASFYGPLPTGQEFADKMFNSYLVTGSRGDLLYYQWLVEAEGGYVVIEEYGYEYYAKVGKNPSYKIGSICLVDYRYFTKEAIDDVQTENAMKYGDI